MKLLKTVISLFAIVLFVPLTMQAQALPALQTQELPAQSVTSDFEKFKKAIDRANPNEVKRLLANKAIDPNATNESKYTPIRYAIEVYSTGFESLFVSSQHTVRLKMLEIIKAFSEDPRVNMNAQDKDGNAPLHAAAKLKVHALEVINILFQNEKIKFNITNRWLETPFHVAAAFTEDPRVIEAFFAVLSEVNPRDFQERTPLLRAIGRYLFEPKIAESFFNEKRVDVKARDFEYRGIHQYAGTDGPRRELIDNALRERGLRARLLQFPKSVRERILRRSGEKKQEGLKPAVECY